VRGKGKFVITEYVVTDEKAGPRYPSLLTTGRILEHLDEPPTPPLIASARGPPHREDGFDPREGTEGTDLSEPLPKFKFNQRVSW
jgi:hypothetical protein